MLKDVRDGELHDRSPIGFDRKGCGIFGVRKGVQHLGVTSFIEDKAGIRLYPRRDCGSWGGVQPAVPDSAVGSELMVGADT